MCTDARLTRLSRRSFLADLGRGGAAVAVFGLAACSSGDDTGTPSASTSASPTTSAAAPTTASASTETAEPTENALQWAEVSFGFVSAFVLARPDGRMTIVDTGTSGGLTMMTQGVEALGGTWADVDHVIATHSHGDHVGSLVDVLQAAPESLGYAGADDLPSITAPRDLVALADGDEVHGFQIVAAPGHTPGSICVYDPTTGLLVAGDAVLSSGGEPTGPSAQFSDDITLANRSVARLAELQVEALLVGHGDPVVDRAGEKLAALAQRLA